MNAPGRCQMDDRHHGQCDPEKSPQISSALVEAPTTQSDENSCNRGAAVRHESAHAAHDETDPACEQGEKPPSLRQNLPDVHRCETRPEDTGDDRMHEGPLRAKFSGSFRRDLRDPTEDREQVVSRELFDRECDTHWNGAQTYSKKQVSHVVKISHERASDEVEAKRLDHLSRDARRRAYTPTSQRGKNDRAHEPDDRQIRKSESDILQIPEQKNPDEKNNRDGSEEVEIQSHHGEPLRWRDEAGNEDDRPEEIFSRRTERPDQTGQKDQTSEWMDQVLPVGLLEKRLEFFFTAFLHAETHSCSLHIWRASEIDSPSGQFIQRHESKTISTRPHHYVTSALE